MNKKIIGIIAVVVIIVVAYFVYDNYKDVDRTDTTPTEDVKTIKIGAILPLTGPIADYGKNALIGQQKAIKDINNLYDDLNFRLIVEDGKTGAKDAVNAYKKIKRNNVDVLTAVSSNIALPILELTVKDSLLFFPASSNSAIVNPIKFNVFRHFVNANQEAELIINNLPNESKNNTLLIIVNDDFGRGFLNAIKEINFDLDHDPIFYDKKESNPQNVFTKVRNINPKNLVLVGYKGFMGNMVKKIYNTKSNFNIYCSYSFILTKANEVAGVDAMENVHYVDLNVSDEILKKYNIKLHQVLDYATIRLIGQVLHENKGDLETLITYLNSVDNIDCGVYKSKFNNHDFKPQIVLK